MANTLSVFVSSSHELRDLRASVRDFLRSLEINPQLSEDPGFPRISGDKPYVTCLRTLGECPLVIGLLERRCGPPLTDWSPFSEYDGLRATHAELRHALKSNKKLLLYIHESTLTAYRQWKSDQSGYASLDGNQGAEVATLELVDELLSYDPAPFYEKFNDASEVLTSLKRNLLNEIYASLKDQEAQNRNRAEYLMEKILSAAPEIRAEIQTQLNPDITKELHKLKEDRDELEKQLTSAQQQSQTSLDTLRREKESLDLRIADLQKQSKSAEMMLTMAAVRDAQWLHIVRTTLMPQQDGRVPFHNSAEIALRGYKTAGGRAKPILVEVTWSRLPDRENNLHRGYKAGLIFQGSEFTPGIVWTSRRRGETGPPPGNTEYFWRLPSTYFGDYLEVPSSEDEAEGPLNYRDYEFQCRNPEGQTSEWIMFSYPFDDAKLLNLARQSADEGRRLVGLGDNKGAIEPLRKAMVFVDRISGLDALETVTLRREWNAALDNATLDKLRFQIGTRVRVVTGEHSGKSGMIQSFGLRQIKPYWILTGDGSMIAAADGEVEVLTESE